MAKTKQSLRGRLAEAKKFTDFVRKDEAHFIDAYTSKLVTALGGLILSVDRQLKSKGVYTRLYNKAQERKKIWDGFLDPEIQEIVDAAFSGVSFDAAVKAIEETVIAASTAAFEEFGAKSAEYHTQEAMKLNLRESAIIQALKSRANLLSGSVAENTFLQLKQRIGHGLFVEGRHPTMVTQNRLGNSLPPISRVIQETMPGVALSRAKLIARTECAALQSYASTLQFQAMGIKKHTWLTALDGHVRPAHVSNQGVVVLIGSPFPSGQLRVGDGPPDLVCNCRCSNAAVVERSVQAPWDGSKRDFDPKIVGSILFEVAKTEIPVDMESGFFGSNLKFNPYHGEHGRFVAAPYKIADEFRPSSGTREKIKAALEKVTYREFGGNEKAFPKVSVAMDQAFLAHLGEHKISHETERWLADSVDGWVKGYSIGRNHGRSECWTTAASLQSHKMVPKDEKEKAFLLLKTFHEEVFRQAYGDKLDIYRKVNGDYALKIAKALKDNPDATGVTFPTRSLQSWTSNAWFAKWGETEYDSGTPIRGGIAIRKSITPDDVWMTHQGSTKFNQYDYQFEVVPGGKKLSVAREDVCNWENMVEYGTG